MEYILIKSTLLIISRQEVIVSNLKKQFCILILLFTTHHGSLRHAYSFHYGFLFLTMVCLINLRDFYRLYLERSVLDSKSREHEYI